MIETICSDLVSALSGGIHTVIDSKKIRRHFLQCGEVIRQFENTGRDSFGEAIRMSFSKENLEAICRKAQKKPGYAMLDFIRRQLEKICEEYDIDGRRFIETFLEMFKECVYVCDRELYSEMYQDEWRREDQERHLQLLSKLDHITGFLEDHDLQEQRTQVFDPSAEPCGETESGADNGIEEAEEALLEWNLRFPQGEEVFSAGAARRNRVLELTDQWKRERREAPSWYVVPKNKRRALAVYTREKDLLYLEEDLSEEERFAFACEVVWRDIVKIS